MASIKAFFEKKKLDRKFKKAGEGHTLTEDTRTKQNTSANRPSTASSSRNQPSGAALTAAEAAIARASQPKPSQQLGTSASSVKLQVRKELEAEKKAQKESLRIAETYQPPTEIVQDAAPILAVSGVLFKCPIAGPAVLPKKEMEKYIEDFLLSQLTQEPAMTSALMIQTLNKDKEKVKNGTTIICKYLENILSHQGEEKYTKIRISNKSLQEKVLSLTGGQEFMQAAGFQRKMVEGPQEIEEEFLVMDPETALDHERIKHLLEVLEEASPVRPELERDIKVFHPSTKASRIEVPDEFYNQSPDELKREQQARQEAVERLGMLRTKEMREREQLRELRKYRYCLIRVRFPDGVIFQATFRATEKLSALIECVRENLENDWMPFNLNSQTGYRLTDEDLSLVELGLAPAAIVNFAFDPTVIEEIAAQQGNANVPFLKGELLATLQTL